MTSLIPWALGAFAVAGLAGYLRVKFGPSTPRAQNRPLDPGGGFASADQIRAHLSADAVRRAGAQVRPSLPVQHLTPKRKGRARDGR